MQATEIDLAALKAEGIVSRKALAAKVILAGKLSRKITLKEVKATKGARSMIEAAGGTLRDHAEAGSAEEAEEGKEGEEGAESAKPTKAPKARGAKA